MTQPACGPTPSSVREGINVFKIDMSEATARFTFVASCGLSTFAAAASIMLGLREAGWPAALFLVLAVAGCLVTLVSYNQYTRQRNARWRVEIKGSEDKLSQVLNHARMGMIIDHVTGPLAAQTADNAQEVAPEERSVAKP